MPALLTSTCTVPNRATTAASIAATAASSLTSAATVIVSPPAAAMAAATAAAASASAGKWFTATFAPARPSASAVARPIPGARAGDERDMARKGELGPSVRLPRSRKLEI